MKNIDIILSDAIQHKIYTREEAAALILAHGCLPLRTFAEWKKLGFSVKKGEKAALVSFIWKPKMSKKMLDDGIKEDGDSVVDYYWTKAHLFTDKQVEPIKS